MIKTFTLNDVIRYVYEETLEEENELIADVLLKDAELQAFYYEVLALKREITTVQKNPSERVVQNIMAFSRDFKPHLVK